MRPIFLETLLTKQSLTLLTLVCWSSSWQTTSMAWLSCYELRRNFKSRSAYCAARGSSFRLYVWQGNLFGRYEFQICELLLPSRIKRTCLVASLWSWIGRSHAAIDGSFIQRRRGRQGKGNALYVSTIQNQSPPTARTIYWALHGSKALRKRWSNVPFVWKTGYNISNPLSSWGMGTTGPSVWKDAGSVHPSLEGVKMVSILTPKVLQPLSNTALSSSPTPHTSQAQQMSITPTCCTTSTLPTTSPRSVSDTYSESRCRTADPKLPKDSNIGIYEVCMELRAENVCAGSQLLSERLFAERLSGMMLRKVPSMYIYASCSARSCLDKSIATKSDFLTNPAPFLYRFPCLFKCSLG